MLGRDEESVHYGELETVVGRILIAYVGESVVRVGYGESERNFLSTLTAQNHQTQPTEELVPITIATAVRKHLSGDRSFSIAAVEFDNVTPFQYRVLAATAAIPYGDVRTYRQIAIAAKAPGAARAVGTALAHNPVPVLIPCHRVIRTDGRLGGYTGGGPLVKQRLLRHEGVVLTNTDGTEVKLLPFA